MKKLNELKIAGHTVIVKFYPVSEMRGLMGSTWNAHNIIQICQDFPESQQEETLIHEILHHCMSNLGLIYDKESQTAIHSERTIESLAQAIYQVLRDNNLAFTGKIESNG